MIYIAHRGNIGEQTKKLPVIDRIKMALSLGYDVEIDLRYIGKSFWVGHDNAEIEIEDEFLSENSKKLWCHCKDFKSLKTCLKLGLTCFWHQSDNYTLTSNGYVWVYPGYDARGGILVMPELLSVTNFSKFVGICSDKIEYYKEIIEMENNDGQN